MLLNKQHTVHCPWIWNILLAAVFICCLSPHKGMDASNFVWCGKHLVGGSKQRWTRLTSEVQTGAFPQPERHHMPEGQNIYTWQSRLGPSGDNDDLYTYMMKILTSVSQKFIKFCGLYWSLGMRAFVHKCTKRDWILNGKLTRMFLPNGHNFTN